jgi:hypothetical protein
VRWRNRPRRIRGFFSFSPGEKVVEVRDGGPHVLFVVGMRGDAWLAQGGLAQGERSPAILCQLITPAPGQDGRIVQIMGRSAAVGEDVNRRAELALRQPANRHPHGEVLLDNADAVIDALPRSAGRITA